jgi:type I restriction enzyme R subunit
MQLIDGANLTDEQHEELQRELNQKKIVITRDDRLDEIAKDIVEHFMGRADGGKAMVVSIDKQTAVRMYDKVKKYWEEKAQSLEEKENR